MNNITLTFPAEWLERIDHVVGFHLPAVRGNDDSGFVVLKLKRLADMLRNVDTVLKGRPSRQELQQALAGVGAGMDIWVKAVEGLTPKLAKVSYGEGPDAYARQHLDSLAGEIRAITMFLSEQKLAPELWGERSLKVALMLLKQAHSPQPSGDAERVQFEQLSSYLTEQAISRAEVLALALKRLREQAQRIEGLDKETFENSQEVRTNGLRTDRDKAVELLNNMFKPALSQAVASLREREAREWLKLKGWLTET
jgi:hypothetical protein